MITMFCRDFERVSESSHLYKKSFTINVDSMNWTFHNDINGDDDDDYHGNFRGNRKQGFAWKWVKRF